MKVWERLLIKGNNNFNQSDMPFAEECYHQAIQCIEQEWLAPYTDSHLLMAWISAFHNLAELYERQGQTTRALHYLKIPHQRMAKLVDQADNSEKLTYIALCGLKMTLMPLIAFSKKYPTCDNCLTSLKRMAMSVNTHLPIMH